jgi:hypothetical protein
MHQFLYDQVKGPTASTGMVTHHDIAEILLMLALNTNQSTN